jgi:hypothetical protein
MPLLLTPGEITLLYPLNWALELKWKGKIFCPYWVMNNDTSVVGPVASSLYYIPVIGIFWAPT